MDLLCVHVKNNGLSLRNSLIEKPICWNSKNYSMALEIRVSRKESLSNCYGYRSVTVRSMGKKNSGSSNSSNSNSSSSSSVASIAGVRISAADVHKFAIAENCIHMKRRVVSAGNSDQPKAGDGLKGNNPLGGNKSGDSGSPKSKDKPLDWREFRSLLYIHEQAENAESVHEQDKIAPGSGPLPLKWAHPISAPENGSLLVATGKLDGVRTFERTVVLLLRSGTRNPQEGPFGIVLNRPLNKKMKHMNPTNAELATTFADCSLYFGGPLDASMFLLRDTENRGLGAFEEVIPGVHFGSRNSLNEAAALVKNGTIRPEELRFFMGYAGWQMDQLIEEIESEYWYVAACSTNLIFGGSQNTSSYGLWEEILQLMGGHYSELSRKPKQDI